MHSTISRTCHLFCNSWVITLGPKSSEILFNISEKKINMQRILITKELTYQNIWKSGTDEMNKIIHNLSRTRTMLFAHLVK